LIATLTEIKALLGITATTYDTQIKSYIPVVEEAICGHCRNDFVDYKANVYTGINEIVVYASKATLSFVKSTNSMNDSDSGLAGLNFKAGDSVRVYNSIHNDQIFTIKTVAAGSIVFEDVDTVNDEAAGTSILVVRLAWPKDLKDVVANMIKFKLDKKVNMALKSETFNDYSYTTADQKEYINGYPRSIMAGLKNYKCMIKKSFPLAALYDR